MDPEVFCGYLYYYIKEKKKAMCAGAGTLQRAARNGRREKPEKVAGDAWEDVGPLAELGAGAASGRPP